MPDIPGLDADIHFGKVGEPLPDWRDVDIEDDEDPDDDDVETPASVTAILGFDPDDEWDDDDDDDPEAKAVLQSDMLLKGCQCHKAETGDADDTEREGEPQRVVDDASKIVAGVLADALAEATAYIEGLRDTPAKGKAASRIVKMTQAQSDELLRLFDRAIRDGLSTRLENAISAMILRGGLAGVAELGDMGVVVPTAAMEPANEAVQEYIQSYRIRLADSVSTTTINALRPQIASMREQGASNVDIAEALRQDESGLFSGARADTIARTESARAYTSGEELAWRQSDAVDGKTWLLAPGACEFCRAAAAQYGDGTDGAKLGEPFYAMGATLTGAEGGTMKLDYSAIDGPPLHPNDRCDIMPVIRGDETKTAAIAAIRRKRMEHG